MFAWIRTLSPTVYLSVACFLAITLLPDFAMAQTAPAVGGSGPINWATFTGLFTGAQGALMQIVAVLGVFCLIAGIFSAIASGFSAVTLALFGGMFGCVCILAAPDLVTWIKSFV